MVGGIGLNTDQVIAEIERYESFLAGVLSRFSGHRAGSIYIAQGDDAAFRQAVIEIVDLFNDALGRNAYSQNIISQFNNGVSNYLESPSYRSVETILGMVRAALTRFKRNPQLLVKRKAEENTRNKDNVFIIHGRDEAKWRELKSIIKDQFRLNPIILSEQPDIGSKTIIEKFEHYAQTCSYAIALFTPDDEVTSGADVYLQARPNVIYELGWFCGRLDRAAVMLLLKEGTSMFSDFGGIIEKRFKANVSEVISDIAKDLTAAGIIEGT